MAKKKRIPKFKSAKIIPKFIGIIDQISKLKKKQKKGANKNNNLSAFVGKIVSLKNNFNPSAIGCNNPKNPIKFGPIRNCVDQ